LADFILFFNLGNTQRGKGAKMNQWMAKVNEMKQLRQGGPATTPSPASTAAGPRK
jgi:hypothetical protein